MIKRRTKSRPERSTESMTESRGMGNRAENKGTESRTESIELKADERIGQKADIKAESGERRAE
jgi:hypothetical protein